MLIESHFVTERDDEKNLLDLRRLKNHNEQTIKGKIFVTFIAYRGSATSLRPPGYTLYLQGQRLYIG